MSDYMEYFTMAKILENALIVINQDLLKANATLERGYQVAVSNWKLNRDQGFTQPVPEPPYKLGIYPQVNGDTGMTVGFYLGNTSEPVCEKYDPLKDVKPVTLVAALGPQLTPTTWLKGAGDNAPEGYVLETGGKKYIKRAVYWFAGASEWYELVEGL